MNCYVDLNYPMNSVPSSEIMFNYMDSFDMLNWISFQEVLSASHDACVWSVSLCPCQPEHSGTVSPQESVFPYVLAERS